MYPLGNTEAEGATMCDEYYDARMKAFWRVLAEQEADEKLEASADEAILKPLVEPFSPAKPKAKALVR